MVKLRKLCIESNNGHTLHHSFYRQERNSNTLVIIIPGGKYNCDRPLLHYIRKLALDKKFDVLSINFDSHFKDYDFNESLFDALYVETKKAIDHCLNQGTYHTINLIGKSMGSLVMGQLVADYAVDFKVKRIYLTPIEKTIPYISAWNGLVFTGTRDPLFSKKMQEVILKTSKSKVHIIEDANHALELKGKISDTMDLHKKIIMICDAYMSD